MIANIHALRSKDVCLLAVCVVQQSNTAGAVGVVFNCRNFGGDAIFVALEVDHAVLLFVSATAVT